LMVDTIIDDTALPIEVIEDALRVDVLSVTKFALARALLVFISPSRLMLLKLAVACDVSVETDRLAVEMFPVALIDDAKMVEGVGTLGGG